MKFRLLSIVCIALIISSCSKSSDNQLSTSLPPSTLSNARLAGLPFKGAIIYHFNTELDLKCDCQQFYPAGTFSGTGNLTHLGLSTSNIKPCVSPIYSGSTYVGNHVGIECASFVASNGDELYLSIHPYDILFTAAGPVGHVVVDFAGGTGRFSTATGSFTGIVTILGATDASLTDINGTISY